MNNYSWTVFFTNCKVVATEVHWGKALWRIPLAQEACQFQLSPYPQPLSMLENAVHHPTLTPPDQKETSSLHHDPKA